VANGKTKDVCIAVRLTWLIRGSSRTSSRIMLEEITQRRTVLSLGEDRVVEQLGDTITTAFGQHVTALRCTSTCTCYGVEVSRNTNPRPKHYLNWFSHII